MANTNDIAKNATKIRQDVKTVARAMLRLRSQMTEVSRNSNALGIDFTAGTYLNAETSNMLFAISAFETLFVTHSTNIAQGADIGDNVAS